MAMTTGSVPCLGPHGFHRLSYTEWGRRDASAPVLVCAHGLTRNGRDFDFLARALEGGHRVVCPDMPGRGESEWLPHADDYGFPVYVGDMAALIARTGAENVDWLGTSMGGLIGMMLAAQPGSPVRRLVLNDVGPHIPRAALGRISEYVGADPRFAGIDGVESYLRQIHAPFGRLTRDQWRHLAVHSARRLPDGTYALRCDPRIGIAFRAQPSEDANLWPVWDAVRCPVLLLRGAESDLLSDRTVQEMRLRGPGKDRMEVREIPAVGHAPALMAADQIEIVAKWLLRPFP